MANPLLSSKFDGDKTHVKLTFVPDGTKNLTAAEISKLIADLAHIRGQMEPAVPEQFSLSDWAHRHTQARWMTGVDADTGQVSFAIRTTTLGWIAFALNPSDAEQLERHIAYARSKVDHMNSVKPN